MGSSVKKNFGFNMILTFCNYIFPIITFPYISRVLGVSNIGVCNYVDSIINFFSIISILGIGSLGIREIAKCKDNTNERSIVFSNLVIFNIILSVLSIILLLILVFFVEKFHPYREFLFIGVIKLAISPFLVEWFFQGIQEFRYITIRSIIIRIIFIIALFLFVHSKQDVLVYYLLLAMQAVVSAIINWMHCRKYVKFSIVGFKPLMYLAPIIVLGYYRILTSLYTTFNTFFLGLMSGDEAVGLFSTATKLNSIVMSVFSAFTAVMVPKVAELLSENKTEELQIIAEKTFSSVITLSLPIVIFCWFNASIIVNLIAGSEYDGAIVPFRIIVFLIVIIGLEQIVIQQFLMSSKNNNKSIAIVSSVGAAVGLLFNFALTPKFAAIGTSISWGISEIAVLFVGLILLRKTLNISFNYSLYRKALSTFLLYIFPLTIVFFFVENSILYLVISAMMVCALFFIINIKLYPNPLITSSLNRILVLIRQKI